MNQSVLPQIIFYQNNINLLDFDQIIAAVIPL